MKKRIKPPGTVNKTLEFKAYLTAAQQQQIDAWLEIQRRVWNEALEMLREFEKFTAYNTHDKAHAPCCPTPWTYRYIPNEMKDGYVPVPFSRVWWDEDGKPVQPPLPEYQEPRLDRDSLFSLQSLFAYKLPANEWLKASGVPSKVTRGTLKDLATSWEEYKKRNRKIPRFKGEKFPITTLSNNDPSSCVQVDGDWITLPNLGRVKIKSANRRWAEGLEIRTYRICKRPSGYYVMLVGEFQEVVLKPSDKACGIDPGVKAAVALDNDNLFPPANPLKKQLSRLKRLQQKASRQQKGSNGQKRTYQQIAKVYEKVKRSRNAFNHKLSTRLVREYGAIAMENTNLQNLTRQAKPKPNEDGTGFLPNGAARKSGSIRALLDVAIGDLRSKIKTKCAALGREFELTPAQYTSQKCHGCGQKGDRRSQSEFVCLNEACSLHGHIQSADGNAAKNHLQNASFRETGKYRAWAWELKREAVMPPVVPLTATATGCDAPEASQEAPSHVSLAPITLTSQPRCLDTFAFSAIDGGSLVPKKVPKRRPSKTRHENPDQLTLWDVGLTSG